MSDLKVGSTGPLVYVIQENLNEVLEKQGVKGQKLKLNAKFDSATLDAVKTFQFMAELDQTGVVDDLTSSALMRSTLDFEIQQPATVTQITTQFHCWAASTSSWLDVRTNKPKKSMADLIKMMKQVSGAVDPRTEGLWTKGWTNLAGRFGMKFQTYGGTKGKPLNVLTPNVILKLLKKNGHIVVAYNLPSGVAHTVVAYGFHILYSDQFMPEYRLKVMDPWPQSGKSSYHSRKLTTFKAGGAVLLLWP